MPAAFLAEPPLPAPPSHVLLCKAAREHQGARPRSRQSLTSRTSRRLTPPPAGARGLVPSAGTVCQALPDPLSPLVLGQTDGFLLGSLAGQHALPIPRSSRASLDTVLPALGEGADDNSGWDGPVGVCRVAWGGGLAGTVVARRCPLAGLPHPTHPSSPSCRGASRPQTATCPTPGPAPATTTWQLWPPHPLWVGSVGPLPPWA